MRFIVKQFRQFNYCLKWCKPQKAPTHGRPCKMHITFTVVCIFRERHYNLSFSTILKTCNFLTLFELSMFSHYFNLQFLAFVNAINSLVCMKS